MIPIGMIEAWKSKAPWSNNDYVEQDLILSRLLIRLFSNEKIKKSLVFKGGTALHKLFVNKAYRYSEDLDFDQITVQPIGELLDIMREIMSEVFSEKPSYDRHEKMYILTYKYRAETPPHSSMKLKIEINTRHHNNFQPLNNLHHQCESSWFSGNNHITTYTIEELLASKLKALYQRNKGRDLFDLWVANELSPDFTKINELCQLMFESEGLVIKKDDFIKNINNKTNNVKFCNDIVPLIPASYEYQIKQAADFVIEYYLQY